MIYRLDYLCPKCNIPHAVIVNEAECKEACLWLIANKCSSWKVVDSVVQVILEDDNNEVYLGKLEIHSHNANFIKFAGYKK
jgi:hypothetical protein